MLTLTSVAAAAGADLFAGNCAVCHGSEARGQYGPDIHCNKAIHDTVRTGRSGSIGTMPAFPFLSDADITEIQDFLGTLCPAPSGAQLFASNCAACHGGDAGGLGGRPNLRCTVRSRVFDAVRNGRGAGLMPIFPSSTLSDTMVDDVAGYLGTLCSGSPQDIFTSNCVTCHGATAGGGRNADGVVAPNIRCTQTPDFLETVQFSDDGGMPRFPEFNSTQVAGIAAYVQQNFCRLGD